MSINLVKIHATASTNDELKLRFRESELPQFTTVYTDRQTAGKGQMGSIWQSEPFKNLTFSTLITDGVRELSSFEINKLVTVSLVEWLRQELKIQAVIKWPNDTLSVNHKLGGILIEHIIQSNKRQATIIGIGLNVNQTEFEQLPKAISLSQITGKTFNLEPLLLSFLTFFKTRLQEPQLSITSYERLMFKIDRTTKFRISDREFEALVQGVDPQGRLILYHGDEQQTYDLKEIEWIY